MRTDIRWTYCAVAGALAVSCGGGLEGELLEALREEEHQELCVGPEVLGVDAFETDDGKLWLARGGDFSFMTRGSSIDALEKLQAEGFAGTEATSMPRSFASYFDAFEVTKKGAEYFRNNEFGILEVCLGRKRAVEIVDYTEPTGGDAGTIEARFRYELEFNDLVDDLDLEDDLEREMSRSWPGEGMAVYVKTNKGWRLEGAFWQ